MPNTEKVSAVAELSGHFSNSSAAVITEYRGLSVKQLSDLRRALGRQTTYAVVKNTLTKRAAADAGVAIADDLLVGPTAIAFVAGDPVEAAKGLRDFARGNPLLVIKGGVLDGKALTVAEIGRIADLESRDVLLARLAGALQALPTRAAALFQAPLSQLARLVQALADKRPAEPADDHATDNQSVDNQSVNAAADDIEAIASYSDSEPIAIEAPSVVLTADEASALPSTDTETPAQPAE